MRAMGLLAFTLSSACEVHGLVGSNDGDAAGSVGDGVGSAIGDDDGAVTTADDDGMDGGTSGAGTGGMGGGHTLKFDVDPGEGIEVCLAPISTSCDRDDDDPWHAIGVGCPGSWEAETELGGHPEAIHVVSGTLGTHGIYSPREGERMVILSTGRAADIPRTHAQLACTNSVFCPSTAFSGVGMSTLPTPIDVTPVHSLLTCTEDPSLVGKGDCSNTLGSEWAQGDDAYDYAEMRLSAKVPDEADALIYQFAFFSAEYPLWANPDAPFNDMYVAWLESEEWTGNVSFDELGNPISINGVFLDFLDADSELCTEGTCVAPELDGFAMEGHAGTRWLETVAPVVPGEEIELIFAVFDLTDASFDTAVLLDGLHWGCTDLPPVTTPTG